MTLSGRLAAERSGASVERPAAGGSDAAGKTSLLRQLIAGFVSSFRGIVPLVFALGCENARTVEIQPDRVGAAVVAPAPAASARTAGLSSIEPVDADESTLGRFNLTFYYVIGEDEVMAKLARRSRRPANSNASAAGAELEGGTQLASTATTGDRDLSNRTVTLYQGKSCAPIAQVSREFANQLALQGTGKLTDGRLVNIWGPCGCDHSPCFKVTETTWGTSGSGRALQPFRTVAVDPGVIKLGSLLYIPELEGRTMPGRPPWGGYVHDGCVVADDTGGGIKGHQLDLFVGRKPYVDALSQKGGSHRWARNIPVFDGSKRCERTGRRVARKSGSI